MGGKTYFKNFSSEDLNNYYNLAKVAGLNNNWQPRLKKINEIIIEREKHGEGIIVLSNDKNELFERLNILLAAKKQGHNSSIEEITGILDQLLKMKAITLKEYRTLCSWTPSNKKFFK